jgi:hypothetical protein
MPALIFPLLGLSLGVFLAWLTADDLAGARLETTGSRGLLATTAFGASVFAPATGYLLAFYPDWCFSYRVDVSRFGPAPLLACALLDAASPAAGFALAARWATTHRPVPVLRLAGTPLLIACALALSQTRRLQTLATYAQFHGDFGTETIAGSPLGYAVLLVGLVTTLGWLWTAHVLRSRTRARHGN